MSSTLVRGQEEENPPINSLSATASASVSRTGRPFTSREVIPAHEFSWSYKYKTDPINCSTVQIAYQLTLPPPLSTPLLSLLPPTLLSLPSLLSLLPPTLLSPPLSCPSLYPTLLSPFTPLPPPSLLSPSTFTPLSHYLHSPLAQRSLPQFWT